jgi:hypothetical protein
MRCTGPMGNAGWRGSKGCPNADEA